jgi:hypothetical protein
VFSLLLIGHIVLAAVAARADPAQRTPRAAGLWLLRVLVGCMRWQRSLWEIPPNFDELRNWMGQEAAHAAVTLQGAFVGDVVLARLSVFGLLVYLIDVAVGVSHCWMCCPASAHCSGSRWP